MNTIYSKSPLKSALLLLIVTSLSPVLCLAQCPGTASGYLFPKESENVVEQGSVAWANPDQVLTVNSTFAEASVSSGEIALTNRLYVRGFQINVPINAVICGIEAEITRKASALDASNGVVDAEVRLLVGNEAVGTSQADLVTKWPVSAATASYGSSSDTWGVALTGFDVTGGGFGLAITASVMRSTGTITAGIDGVRIRLHYYVPVGDPFAGSSFSCSSFLRSKVQLEAAADARLVTLEAGSTELHVLRREETEGIVFDHPIVLSDTANQEYYILTLQDVVSQTDYSTQVFHFRQPVGDLSFIIQDVDILSGFFTDAVEVNAYRNGVVVALNPSNLIVNSTYNQYAGNNRFVGVAPTGTNDPATFIHVLIPGRVDSVQFVYRNLDAGLASQGYCLADISFCSVFAGVEEFTNEGVEIYPNPVAGLLTVSSADAIRSFELINDAGAPVLSYQGTGEFTVTPDLSRLANGVYLLVISTDGGIRRQRVVVSH